MRRGVWATGLVVWMGCGSVPENEAEFFEEIGTDWCSCAEVEMPEEVPDGVEQCASGVVDLVLLISSDDACTYDPDAAKACVAITRPAEVTCDEGVAVFYDGVAFEEIPECAGVYLCAEPET